MSYRGYLLRDLIVTRPVGQLLDASEPLDTSMQRPHAWIHWILDDGVVHNGGPDGGKIVHSWGRWLCDGESSWQGIKLRSFAFDICLADEECRLLVIKRLEYARENGLVATFINKERLANFL